MKTKTKAKLHYRVEVRKGKEVAWRPYGNYQHAARAVQEGNVATEAGLDARVMECWLEDGKCKHAVHWTPADEIPFLTADLEPTERQLKAEDAQAWAEFYA